MGWETRPHYLNAWGGLNIMLSRPMYVCNVLWRERVSLLIRTNSATPPTGPLIGPISDSPDTGAPLI